MTDPVVPPVSPVPALDVASVVERVPPLHLPVGSVRALITLAVLATTWVQLLRGRPIGAEVHDTLLLVLGYYFGARAGRPAADALAAAADREANQRDPLYLPRGAIRLLILVGFAGVAWKLHQSGALFGPNGPQPVLVLVATFLAGALVKGALSWLGHLVSNKITNVFGHLAATITLAIVLGYLGVEVLGARESLPPAAAPTFLGVVGFYLGKR